MTTKVYLGVGSNLNRDNALRFAKKELSALFSNVKCSSVWESRPVREAEPDYYNIVIGGDCDLSLDDLVAKLAEIELSAGKEMMFHNGTNFGIKRRLDVDVLVYGDLVTTEPCKLPRHDIQDYPFVLCPLCEIDPDFIHPLLKVRVSELWQEMEPRLPEKMKVNKVDFDWEVAAPSWTKE